jgi:hypothetical protein
LTYSRIEKGPTTSTRVPRASPTLLYRFGIEVALESKLEVIGDKGRDVLGVVLHYGTIVRSLRDDIATWI